MTPSNDNHLIWSSLKRKSYTKFLYKMSKQVLQECGKLYFKYFQFQKWYNSDKWRKLMTIHLNLKFIKWKSYKKIPAQYVKVWKTVYFQYSKFQKGYYNSYRNWWNRTSDVHSVKVLYKISAQHVKVCRRKVQKTMTDGRKPGRTDRHHHTIIRPVWRRACKKIWPGLDIDGQRDKVVCEA